MVYLCMCNTMHAPCMPALNFLTYRHPDVDVDVVMNRLSSSACIQREQLPVERVSSCSIIKFSIFIVIYPTGVVQGIFAFSLII